LINSVIRKHKFLVGFFLLLKGVVSVVINGVLIGRVIILLSCLSLTVNVCIICNRSFLIGAFDQPLAELIWSYHRVPLVHRCIHGSLHDFERLRVPGSLLDKSDEGVSFDDTDGLAS
jgi:hypothetical protein